MKKIKEFLIKYPMHPLLFSIYSMMFYYVGLKMPSPKWELIPACFLVVIPTVLIWSTIYLLSKNNYKSAILTSLFVIPLLFFDGLYELLVKEGIFSYPVHIFLTTMNGQFSIFLGLILVYILITLILLRVRTEMKMVSFFLDIVGLTLVLSSLFTVIFFRGTAEETRLGDGKKLISTWADYSNEQLISLQPTKIFTEDIYYLVVDGYGSSRDLSDLYSYSNSELTAFLAERGFLVVNDARTNYNQTRFSISSTLNLSLIQPIVDDLQIGRDDTYTPIYLINHNLVFDFLRENGYKIVTFSTGLDITDVKESDIYYITPNTPSPFVNQVVNNTALSLLYWKQQYNWNGDRVDFTFDQLRELNSIEEPFFVYAHVMLPHPPFIYTPSGERIIPEKKFDFRDNSAFVMLDYRENYLSGYRSQVEFASKRIMDIVNEIQVNSPNAIIIIQGDHGPGAYFEQEDMEGSNLNEKFHILNAYYFPDRDYSSIAEDITPVNTFRAVLNKFFGTNLEMLENASYYSGYELPYEFVDITSRLR